MNLNEYQAAAATTAFADHGIPHLAYYGLGIGGEAGEVADKIKKVFRDGGGDIDPARKDEIVAELGDVLWYVAMIANEVGVDLDEVACRNVQKLADRQKRGVLGGSGDER